MTELSLSIKNIDTSLINSIRRCMIANVQTIAIDIIKVKENNGLIPDEILGHRLGLIPIKRLNKYTQSGSFTLNVKNNTQELLTVYSKDLIPTSDDIIICDPNIIITKLDTGHSIDLIAEAFVGCGYDHAKWNPTCGLAYKLNTDNSYTMNIETTGSMEPKEILIDAIDILIDKYEKLLV